MKRHKAESETRGCDGRNGERFEIDPAAVAAYRRELRAMVRGMPFAEEGVEALSDWEVVRAMERLWAAAGPPARGES